MNGLESELKTMGQLHNHIYKLHNYIYSLG
jgi:hypothetical protein